MKHYTHLLFFNVLMVIGLSTRAQVSEAEFQALKDLYNSTNGDSWTDNTGWENINTTATKEDVTSSWFGLSVSGGQVKSIDLGNNNLSGTLPESFGDFIHATEIFLVNNDISGSLPSSIGDLSSLVVFQGYDNKFSGSIPTTIGNLTNLENFYFSLNDFTGALPDELNTLVNLKVLVLSENNITQFPASMSNWGNLKELQLNKNDLSGELTSAIGDLTNLEVLNLTDNNLSGTLPSEIGNLTQLKRLELWYNGFSGDLPASLSNLTNLEVLRVSNNQFTGSIPAFLATLTNVTSTLEFENNKFTDMPDLSSASWNNIKVANNQLDFEDLVPNKNKLSSYAPQAGFDPATNEYQAVQGEDVTLEIVFNQSVSMLEYQWYYENSMINGANNATLLLGSIGASEFGAYHCVLTHPDLPQLEITGTDIIVIDVSKMDQTISFDAIPDKTFGDDPFTISASTSSGLPVDFSVENGDAIVNVDEVTITGAGEVTIKASQAGNGDYNAATPVLQSFTVAKADQLITVEDIPTKLVSDDPFDVVASVNSGINLMYSVSGPATINGTTITLTGTPGTVVVTVSNQGNLNYNPVETDISFEATDKKTQKIDFPPIKDKTFGDAPFTISATASSGLEVSFNIISGPAELDKNEVTLIGAGKVTIEATQEGNETYGPATPVQQSFTVNKAAQTITFDSIEDQFLEAESIEISSSASSGLSVQLNVEDGPATIEGNTVTFTGTGKVTIKAAQPGNENYLAAEPVIQNFSITTVTAVRDEGSEEVISVYPNPVNNYLSIKYVDRDSISHLTITDLKGQHIMTISDFSSPKIDVSELETGIYLLSIVDDDHKSVIRLLKN